MRKVKRYGMSVLALIVALGVAGCSGDKAKSGFDMGKEIHLISREDGSGTRGAFIELLGIEVKENGKKKDRTSGRAQITNSTNVMMTQVANDEYGIGYISLGSLNDTVKALAIDGTEATTANIMNGTYKLARPFHLVHTDSNVNGEQIDDFISFVFSADGQNIVTNQGYVSVETNPKTYTAQNAHGKLVVAGSSSITPVMEKLAEAYMKLNPDMKVEIQQSDSTTGVQSVISGTADIGMASRDLKASEKDKVNGVVIAKDGLAVIVNKQNPLQSIKADQVRDIYIDNIKKWQEIK